MKYLKIERNKGFYSTDGQKWQPIDELSKEDLLKLVDCAVKKEFDMDVFDASKIANQAHQIIYQNIYEKLDELRENKTRFKDESKALYKDAISKYKDATE